MDTNTVVIKDPVPAHVSLRVADIGAGGSGPVLFTDGSPSSGLTYNFVSLGDVGDDVSFSSDNGANWTYVPVNGANGADPLVTDIRIHPKGALNANNGQFTVRLRVVVD